MISLSAHNFDVSYFHQKDNNCIFLIGDTNFTSESEMDTIKDKFLDAWPVLYPNDPGIALYCIQLKLPQLITINHN